MNVVAADEWDSTPLPLAAVAGTAEAPALVQLLLLLERGAEFCDVLEPCTA